MTKSRKIAIACGAALVLVCARSSYHVQASQHHGPKRQSRRA